MNKKILLACALATSVNGIHAKVTVTAESNLPRVAHMTMSVTTKNPSNEVYTAICREKKTLGEKSLEEQIAMMRLMYLLVREAPELNGVISLGLNEPEVTRNALTCSISRCIRINDITDANEAQWEAVLERCSVLVEYCQDSGDDFDIDYFLSEILAIAQMSDGIES